MSTWLGDKVPRYLAKPYFWMCLWACFQIRLTFEPGNSARQTALPAADGCYCSVAKSLFATPWTAACQASLPFTVFWSLLKLMSMSDAIQPSLCPWWCHPAISSFVVPFSSCLHSFPTSGSLPMSQFCASGGQSIEVSTSASVLPIIFRTDFL